MTPFYTGPGVTLYQGDSLAVLQSLPSESVNCCVTSPPYWGLRDYGVDGQLGLEKTPEEFIAKMVSVFAEVRRVLRGDGTCWVNIGDSYNAQPGQRKTTDKVGPKQNTNAGSSTIGSRSVESLKPKDLVGIPWMLAFALRADGWYLRSDIIWHKPNPMPESVTDRPTKAHEHLFLLAKSKAYYYDAEAIAEKGVLDAGTKRNFMANPDRNEKDARKGVEVDGNRNKRSVWTVATQPFAEAHFATFPPKLVEPCILAGCPRDGVVLDPFSGSGTTIEVALRNARDAIGIELSPDYCAMSVEARRFDDLCGKALFGMEAFA